MKQSVPRVVLSQWRGAMVWAGPSKAVHVGISALPGKSTPIPLILRFTCYMAKSFAEWLHPKCLPLKYQACSRITP